MKKIITCMIFGLLSLISCTEYDEIAIWNKSEYIDSRLAALEELCSRMNTYITSLQLIVEALQGNDYVTGVTPVVENGKTIGYTITFIKSGPVTIYHGKDGQQGTAPVIGIKQDGGIYYWTLDGEFIVADGQKIKAQGTDGNNGADGSDGVTPKLEIREGYWWISYDNGTNWTQLGKATGEDGKDADSIKITQDENNVYFELADGTIITISKTGQSSNFITFEDINVKLVCLKNWDTNGDGELSYEEAAAVTSIGTLFKENTDIISFKELEYFTNLTAIDDNAFYHCDNLVSIVIPKNVKTIGKSVFYPNITGIGPGRPESISHSSLASIILPDGLISIGANAFFSCANLSNITIPQSVLTIEDFAFHSCKKLTSVTVTNGTIGKSAFSFCDNLVNVTIGNGVTEIGQSAFASCYDLNFYCKSLTPPTLGDDALYKPVKIYVPHSVVDKYKTKTNWRNYADSIIGYDFSE